MRNWIRTNTEFLQQFALLLPLLAGCFWFAVEMSEMQRDLDARIEANRPHREAEEAKNLADLNASIHACMDRKGRVVDSYSLRGQYGGNLTFIVCSK